MGRTRKDDTEQSSDIPMKKKGVQKRILKRVAKGSSLYRNARAINTFLQADKYVKESMLNNASKAFVQTWVDVILDILKGDVTITRDQYAELRCLNHHLEQLKESKTPLHVKKYLLKQQGGIFPLLASIVKPLIGPILGSFLK